MSDYTPTTDEVFEATLYTWVDWKRVYGDEDAARDGFDRWLAQVKAEAQVRELRELASDARFAPDKMLDEHDITDRADRIAREAGIETGETK